MMGARKAGLLHRLINDQTLPSILAKMPPNDWHQWARERPTWMREAIEEAFWTFVDQKWRWQRRSRQPGGRGAEEAPLRSLTGRGQRRLPRDWHRPQYT
jgi:hypothetical protein